MKSYTLHTMLCAGCLVGVSCCETAKIRDKSSETAKVCDKSYNIALLRIQNKELDQQYMGPAWKYDSICETMADHYRCGRYDQSSFPDMESYFRRRIGKMTISELKGLLGEPRVVSPKDDYYTYALAGLYYDSSGQPEEVPHDKHDQVLHYGENGPPEHSIPDESFSIFFVMKDGVVIYLRTLF